MNVYPSPEMAAAKDDKLLLPRLPELCETCRQLLDDMEGAAETTGSWITQEEVLKGLHLLKTAANVVSQLDLFSQNKNLEEIAP